MAHVVAVALHLARPRWYRFGALVDSPVSSTRTGVGATGTGTGAAARVTFASEQEPTGWNNATASESLLATAVIVENVYPSAFVQTPDLDVAMNDDLLVSAEQVADDPQVVEYRIREEARWSDGTPISADDFAYAWRQQNGSIPGNDVASTVGYERIASVEGSAGDKVVTVTFAEPFGPWEGLFYQLLPAHIMRDLPGRGATASTGPACRGSRASPSGWSTTRPVRA